MPDILTRMKSAYAEYLKSPCDTCHCKDDDCDEICFSCQRRQNHKKESEKALLALMPELCEAADAGTVTNWPCIIGQRVFAIKGCFYLPYSNYSPTSIIECEVRGRKETAKRKIILLKPLIEETFGERSAYKWFPVSAFGKTVFLTEAEARKALEAQNEDRR
jgi:hypothetical protein